MLTTLPPLLALALALPDPPSPAADLAALAAIAAPSGHEGRLRSALAEQLVPASLRFEREPLNLTWTRSPDAPAVVVVAPLDEEGFLVSRVTEDGWLRLQGLSREPHPLAAQWLLGGLLELDGRSGPLPAVIAGASTHLRRGGPAQTAIASLSEVWAEIGADSAAAAGRMGVAVLTPAARGRSTSRLAGANRLAGPGLGHRALSYALLLAARALEASPPAESCALVFAAQALPGRRGEQVAARRFPAPRRVFLLRSDLALARREGKVLYRAADLSLGSGVLAQGLSESERAALNARGIRVADAAGPEARPAPYTGGPQWPERAPALLGLPARYALTPVEMVDSGDAVELARALVTLLGGDPERVAPIGLTPPAPAAAPFAPGSSAAWLAKLVEPIAISGGEQPARTAVSAGLPAWARPGTDPAGNLVVQVEPDRPSDRPPILFVAHLDEIGFEVTGFDSLGRARLKALGGFFPSFFEARAAQVVTAEGTLAGVITPRDGDLEPTAREPRVEELALDLGAPAESLGVRPGDRATLRRTLRRIGPHRLSARSLDDRVGSTALLLALRRLDRARLERPVVFAWSTEEEVGLKGALRLAEHIAPEVVFPVDTFVSADSPLEDGRFAFQPLGAGAVVRAADHSNLAPPDLVDRVVGLAREERIPLQVGVTGGGNDGAAFAALGIPDVPLAWPLRSSHSGAEMMDERDLESLALLVQAIAERW